MTRTQTFFTIILCFAATAPASLYAAPAQPAPALTAAQPSEGNRRLVILADLGNELDEEQQMAHMLINCNEFDLEALIAVTGKSLHPRSVPKVGRHLEPPF